jgi:hypothetical protein
LRDDQAAKKSRGGENFFLCGGYLTRSILGPKLSLPAVSILKLWRLL